MRIFMAHYVQGMVPGAKGDSEKSKAAFRFRNLIIGACCSGGRRGSAGGVNRKGSLKEWQYKLKYNYETKHKAQGVFHSQGMEQKDFLKKRE